MKTAIDLSSKLGSGDPIQAVIPLFHRREKGRVKHARGAGTDRDKYLGKVSVRGPERRANKICRSIRGLTDILKHRTDVYQRSDTLV